MQQELFATQPLPRDGPMCYTTDGDFMNNIPVYVSSGGTATLILREIPHKKTAYILLRTVLPGGLPELMEDCMSTCRGFGAAHCLFSCEDSSVSIPLPHAYDILRLRVQKAALPPLEAPISLTPISPENDSIYQRIYNLCFRDVSHALTYERDQLSRIYREGHRAYLAFAPDGAPCGMGELHGNELAAVGLLPEYRGRGKALTLSLLAHCPGPEITLTVVSDNERALNLYGAMGFTVTGRESTWYKG